MSTLVQVRRESNFALIVPVQKPHRQHLVSVCPGSFNIYEFLTDTDIVAIDFETKGNDISAPDFEVMGLGLATRKSIVYLDLRSFTDIERRSLYAALCAHGNLIAHNVQFDAGCLAFEFRRLGMVPFSPSFFPFSACTYGLYVQCANEGWKGQRWGIKDAMVEVLGWESANETLRDQWLVDNGYVKGSGKGARPDLSQMWRVPPEILGPYCAADADACYLLFTEVLQPVAERFTELVDFHQRYFLHNVRILIDAKFEGIALDVERLECVNREMQADIESSRVEFESHAQIAPLIQKWRESKAAKFQESPPERLTKKGKVSKSYEAWEAKIEKILNGTHPKIKFNINSGSQLRWLFYTHLYDYTITEQPEGDKKGKARIFLSKDYKQFLDVELTAAGLVPVSKGLLPSFGEPGKLLAKHHKIIKAQQYVQSYLDLQRNGRLYPSFVAPGTKTGRLSGKDPNIQQVPKIIEVLECFLPDTDWVILDADFTALEQVVLAEFSRDASLMKLYGPGASPHNDIYLFNACSMGSLGAKIRAYYDPDHPTAESKEEAKRVCKKERGIAKGITLGKSYGAGVTKLYNTLRLGGVSITVAEVEEMVRGFNELYRGSQEYGKWLESQWKANNGWVLNGIGRPVCVYHKFLKDVTNRCLTGNTLVWTDSGLKPLMDVRKEDRVWDGEEWVNHSGLVYQGTREVVELNGVSMTSDHKVLIDSAWKEAKDVRVDEIEERMPRVGWKEVWRLCCHLARSLAKKQS